MKMDQAIEFISQPWHWSVSGLAIAFTMFLLVYLGQRFGVSSSFEAFCDLAGAGKKVNYFKDAFKARKWQLVFLAGSIIGGFVATQWLGSPNPVQISDETIQDLANLGVSTPSTLSEGTGFLPSAISFDNLFSIQGLILMVGGGFLIGFGTRWAGGCTSGHAISGLANLELPSLIAVIGFFAGGLLTTFVLLPLILSI
jgi:uncharacterized membrane protein YedE/YeeE